MTRKCRIVAIVGALLLASSEPGFAQMKNLFDEGQGDRVVHQPHYDTLWIAGNSLSDTLFATPIAIALSDGGVYIGDSQMLRVYYFSDSGDVVWGWGSPGRGPQELMMLRGIDRDVNGGVVLVDPVNRRLVRIDSNGEWRGNVSLDELPGTTVDDVVALGSGGYVLGTDNREDEGPWPIVTADGGSPAFASVPWPGFHDMHFLQWNGAMTRWKEDLWVVGFKRGNGWFLFDRQTVKGAHRYVHHVDFPVLESSRQSSSSGDRTTVTTSTGFATRPTTAAYDLAVASDTLYALSHDDDGGLLDMYTVADGRYVQSLRLPLVAHLVAVKGDTLYLVSRSGLLPTLIALKRRSTPPGA